jgi:hypothetical protein
MKAFLYSSLFFLLLTACNNDVKETTENIQSENEDDAARNFIRSVLDQDFEKARGMMVNDSLNNQYLDATERSFRERLSVEERIRYREANIQNYQTRKINDSMIVAYYSNSYKKKDDSLKLVRSNGQWLVDLKYSFPALKELDGQ